MNCFLSLSCFCPTSEAPILSLCPYTAHTLPQNSPKEQHTHSRIYQRFYLTPQLNQMLRQRLLPIPKSLKRTTPENIDDAAFPTPDHRAVEPRRRDKNSSASWIVRDICKYGDDSTANEPTVTAGSFQKLNVVVELVWDKSSVCTRVNTR